MSDSDKESLRERQTRERKRAIHSAAVDLVLEHGLENVTVAQIAQSAQVSNRTFFNYYPTKESAIIGLSDSAEVAADLQNFIVEYEPRRDSLAEDLSYTIRAAFEFILPPSDSKQQVRLIQTTYPHLAALSMETMRHYDEEIVGGVRRRVERHGMVFPDEETAVRVSRMLTQLCSTPIQHAFRSAKFDAKKELTEEQADEAFAKSVALFQHVIERLK